MRKLLPTLFIITGVFFLMQVLWPIIGVKLQDNFFNKKLVSPNSVLGVSIKETAGFPAIVSTNQRTTPAPFEKFSISIPSIELFNELVLVDSNDLDKGLIHLPGSALPGERGNVFVSGHSMLPVFVKSKNAPFENLTKVKLGDVIKVEALGAQFTYKVISVKTVNPKDLSVINPRDNLGRYISLMTCVPPGINLKRLIVLGSLTP